jgi:Tol biopolymer transport system component
MCVLALGVMGCSETAGTSGGGGSAGTGGTAGDGGSAGEGGEGGSTEAIEWIAGIDFRVGVSSSENSDILYLTESDLDEYKPAYSPDGSKIVFFRALEYGDGHVVHWKSQVFVMNADGSDVRQLTGGDFMDFNPMWTRDGSNRITFTRFGPTASAEGVVPSGMWIYRTSPDADIGDEELISDPAQFEMGYSSLKDGRMLVRREIAQKYFLLTPNSTGTPQYQELNYPFENTYLHKMTVSHSETKLAYMKVENFKDLDGLTKDAYGPAVIAYADFDADALSIENEVEITEYDESKTSWYPSWDPDEQFIIYAHSGVINAYFLDTGETTQISSHDDLEYRYPNVVGSVK